MKLHFIEEPELEFGRDRHICPRAGIATYDVYDARSQARRDTILVGGVGPTDALDKLKVWLDRCSRVIPQKPNTRQPNLYPAFCGFNRSIGFRAALVLEEQNTRWLNHSALRRILKIESRNQRVEEAVDLYYRQIKFLAENRNVDVIVCVIPSDLYQVIAFEETTSVEESLEDEEEDAYYETNFRRALKAKAMHLGVPLQLTRDLSLEANASSQQDDATKAWNFCTALYYKANKTVPWKLVTNVHRPSVCFVGIGFYRSRDRQVLHTSLAQIFDELGSSVILRGTPVDIDKNDRKPHLTTQQAYDLLTRALDEYAVALENSPSRLVVHKSSNFSAAELAGFREASDAMRVQAVDFVTLLDTKLRLFRQGAYPPYRGTHIEVDRNTHLLYTRGSVAYYETYPGLYVPQPLEIRIVEADESPSVICREILSLTKMNWNNTQFDGKYPITLACARKVGQIMKYLAPEEKPQIRYSYYM